MKKELKLTVDQFSLYTEMEKRRDRLLYFANYEGSDHITLSYYGWAINRTISYSLIDEYSVINAAQKEARRLALQIQDDMDSLTQSDEKETKETSQQDILCSLPDLLRKLFRRLTSRTSK